MQIQQLALNLKYLIFATKYEYLNYWCYNNTIFS